MRAIAQLCAGTLVLLLAACASTGTHSLAAPPTTIDSQTAVEAYRIGVDDVVKVSVWRNPELEVTAPVRPDGHISVPLVGDVAAGGRTTTEVADDIKARLAQFVQEPQVTVILTDLRSHEYLSRVRVTGAVKQPVSIPYRQGMTVLDAVLAAGGVTEFAAPNRAGLYRQGDAGTSSYSVELGRILDHGELATNYPVAPGDVITVPERAL